MKLFRLTTAFAGFMAITALAAPASERVGDFALLDHNGTFHQLSYYGDQAAVVLTTQSLNNAQAKEQAATLAKLEAKYGEQNVVFFLLNSQPNDTRDALAAQAKTLGHGIPVLLDESQLVAESLALTQVGELVVIDPKAMRVAFRGGLDNASQQALDSLLSSPTGTSAAATATTKVDGAKLVFAAQQKHQANPPSYTNDIAPILESNCVSCHHEGGIGPWSMSNHAMVRGWAPMMREVVMTRRMPPGQIDTHVGRPISDVAGLTIAEQQKLVHWIDAGAPMEDGAKDPLAALTFDNPKFTMGEPDMILKVPAQKIPATGIIDYRYVPVELNLDRDVWVQAMEFVPGDQQVLHHVIAYLSSPADKTARGRATGSARGDSVGGFAPGRPGERFRDNSGRLITKGSNLLLQMHYTTSGKETTDATEIGLFLHDKPPAYIMAGGVAGQRRFLVPPHAKEHKLVGEQEIERDAYLYSMQPHMHYRGKYMSYSALYPDGSSELLLSVPKYDFNWQFNYELQEPVFLPAGTKLIAKGAMDNSERNTGNPDPSKPVHFGLQTKHEMFFGFTTLRYDGDTPESLLVEKPMNAVGLKSNSKPIKEQQAPTATTPGQ